MDVFDEYRKSFENLLRRYSDIIKDRVLFYSKLDYDSVALMEAEKQARNDIITLFGAVIRIAKKYEEDLNGRDEDAGEA